MEGRFRKRVFIRVMHLIILTSHFPPSWGGVESQNLEVARYMASKGHSVDVVCVGENVGDESLQEKFRAESIRVTYANKLATTGLDHVNIIKQFVQIARSLIDSSGQDTLIEAHEKESALAAVCLKLLYGRKSKTVWFLHGPDMFCSKNMPLLKSQDFCEGVGRDLAGYYKC